MPRQRTQMSKGRSRAIGLGMTLPWLIFLGATSLSAQTVMDELGGTRQRLSISCAAMMVAASQGPPLVGNPLIDQLNNNMDLAQRGESNAQFLMRFFDFHAARAGLVAGQTQTQEVLDGAHRASFLLAQLANSGDVASLDRIAEACIMVFRSGP